MSHHDHDELSQSTQPSQHMVYDYTAQQQYRRQVDDYRRRMDDLIRENTALKRYNENLRTQQHELTLKLSKLSKLSTNTDANVNTSGVTVPRTQQIKTSVSIEQIKKYVDEMLENQDINIYGFPDVIEKQIYRNMFTMLLNVIDHTLDTSEIILFGHKIVFDIQPGGDSSQQHHHPQTPTSDTQE